MRMNRLGIALGMLCAAGVAGATPLELHYTVTDQGNGTYLYNFTLTNTNADGSWFAGQNFDWIIWGDVPNNGTSPLSNWIGDVSSLSGTNWADDGFSYSGGGHNGPTLLDVGPPPPPFIGFAPTAVGDSVTWSGTSTANLGEGQMQWSNLIGTGVHADYVVAILDNGGGGCEADFNGDNQVDFFDYLDFVAAFDAEDDSADFNGDNQVDFFDYLDFAAAFDNCQ